VSLFEKISLYQLVTDRGYKEADMLSRKQLKLF